MANRYQYETSPRKLKPEYETAKTKQKINKPNNKTKNKSVPKVNNKKLILYVVLIFTILFAISYRNALIAQKYNQIKGLKTELSDLEKENKQLEVNIESKTNLGNIEEKGMQELGLQKLNESQKVYISIDKQDYVESSKEEIDVEEYTSFFNKVINKIKNIF